MIFEHPNYGPLRFPAHLASKLRSQGWKDVHFDYEWAVPARLSCASGGWQLLVMSDPPALISAHSDIGAATAVAKAAAQYGVQLDVRAELRRLRAVPAVMTAQALQNLMDNKREQPAPETLQALLPLYFAVPERRLIL